MMPNSQNFNEIWIGNASKWFKFNQQPYLKTYRILDYQVNDFFQLGAEYEFKI